MMLPYSWEYKFQYLENSAILEKEVLGIYIHGVLFNER